ncbi:hypothetical protein [Halosimplex sp. J119]
MIEPLADPAPYYDVEWLDCIRCGGNGEHVECYDDLCHAAGHCMHGDNLCNLCEGIGLITEELAERWRRRDAFESVTAPDADLRARGKLHAAARDRRQEADAA